MVIQEEASHSWKMRAERRSRRRASGFKTRIFGGFDEGQVLDYLSTLQHSLEKEIEGYEYHINKQHINEQDKKQEMRQRGNLAGLSCKIISESERLNTRRMRRCLWGIITAILLLSGLTVLLFVAAGIDRVEGDSMYPSLQSGDIILFSRLDPEILQGDIVVFIQPETKSHTVKRIAGLPGDTVEVEQDGRIIVNGRLVREPYVTIPDIGFTDSTPLTVMDGHYFVLGDNRGESLDSRYSQIGTVKKEDILGKVVLLIRRN